MKIKDDPELVNDISRIIQAAFAEGFDRGAEGQERTVAWTTSYTLKATRDFRARSFAVSVHH